MKMCDILALTNMEGVKEVNDTSQAVRTEAPRTIETPPLSTVPRAALLHRCIAKFVDLLIVAALAGLPSSVGFYAGLTYLLVADGLSRGRSAGKRLIGLEVVLNVGPRPATIAFRESILRNAPLAAAYLLYTTLPYVGWLLGLSIVAIETLLMIGNERGQRLGDELAGTQVIERRAEEARGWDL